jgi:hypothetical protein
MTRRYEMRRAKDDVARLVGRALENGRKSAKPTASLG